MRTLTHFFLLTLLFAGISQVAGQSVLPDLSKPFDVGACLASSQKQQAADDAATSARFSRSSGTQKATARDGSTTSPFVEATSVNRAMKEARDAACDRTKQLYDEAKQRSVDATMAEMQGKLNKAIANSKPAQASAAVRGYSTYWMFCFASYARNSESLISDNHWETAVFPVLINRTGVPIAWVDANNPPGVAITREFHDYVSSTYHPPYAAMACSSGFADKAAAEQAQSNIIHKPNAIPRSVTMTNWKWSGDRLTMPDN